MSEDIFNLFGAPPSDDDSKSDGPPPEIVEIVGNLLPFFVIGKLRNVDDPSPEQVEQAMKESLETALNLAMLGKMVNDVSLMHSVIHLMDPGHKCSFRDDSPEERAKKIKAAPKFDFEMVHVFFAYETSVLATLSLMREAILAQGWHLQAKELMPEDIKRMEQYAQMSQMKVPDNAADLQEKIWLDLPDLEPYDISQRSSSWDKLYECNDCADVDGKVVYHDPLERYHLVRDLDNGDEWDYDDDDTNAEQCGDCSDSHTVVYHPTAIDEHDRDLCRDLIGEGSPIRMAEHDLKFPKCWCHCHQQP